MSYSGHSISKQGPDINGLNPMSGISLPNLCFLCVFFVFNCDFLLVNLTCSDVLRYLLFVLATT